MKRIVALRGLLFTSLLVLSSATWAVQNGPYIGLGAGYGYALTPNAKLFDTTGGTSTQNSFTSGGLAGRGFAGFVFTSNIGIEAGYTGYPAATYKANFNSMNSKLLYTTRTIDAVVKGYLSIYVVNFYALGGVAYVMESAKYTSGGVPYNPNYEEPLPNNNINYHKYRPKYGVGVSVDCKNHFTVGMEATQILGLGSFHTQPYSVPSLNFYTLYVQYDFDVYRTTF